MNKKLVCLMLALMMLMCMGTAGLAIVNSGLCPNSQYGDHDWQETGNALCHVACECGASGYRHFYNDQTPGVCETCDAPCVHAFSGTARCVNCYYYFCPHDEIGSDKACAVCACEIAVVTYDPGEGSGTPIVEKIVYKSDAVYQLPECTFTAPNGAEFLGWDVNGQTHSAGSWVSVEDGMIIKAQWDIPTYKAYYYNTIEEVWYSFDHTGSHMVLAPDSTELGFSTPTGKKFDSWLVIVDDEVIDYVYPGAVLPGTHNWDFKPNWIDAQPSEYTVMLNAGDGQVKAFDAATNSTSWQKTFSYTMEAGAYDMLPSENDMIAPDGYELRYFLINGAEKLGYSDVYQVTDNTTIEAVWQLIGTVNTYTVYFDGNGATGGTMKPQTFTEGVAQALTKNAFVREGAEFLGWLYDKENLNDGYSDEQAIEVEDDMTLYAHWMQTITFDPNNGVEQAQTGYIPKGTVIPEMETPSDLNFSDKEGHTFAGWSDGTKVYLAGEPYTVTDSVTLTAQWTALNYTIDFDANGGSGTMAPLTVAYGTSTQLPACTFTAPEGKQFKAWLLYDNECAPALLFTPHASTTVKALWQDADVAPQYYTISLDLDGATDKNGLAVATYQLPANGTFTMPHPIENLGATAPEGKRFKTWIIDGAEVAVGTTMTATGDIRAKVVWEDIPVGTYTIVYKSNSSGEAETYVVDVTQGTKHALLENMFTAPEGMTFRCWLFPVPPAFTQTEEHDPGDEFSSRSSITLTFIADWQAKPYTVAFDANGGSGEMASEGVAYGKSYTLPSCSFTAPVGHHFAGWSVNGTTCQAGESFTVAGDMTVKAVWAKNIYTVTIVDSNYETGAVSESVEYGTSYTLPACTYTPTSEYHSFAHWKVESAAGVSTHGVGAKITIESDTKISAMWDFDNSVQTKIEQTSDIASLPPAQKAALEEELFKEMPSDLKTVEAVVTELETQAAQTGCAVETVEVHDVKLMFKPADSNEWIEATEENFPTAGIEVRMPIPEGANATDFDFVVIHMFTVDSERLGIKAGETETVIPKIVGNELVFTLSGLSPVSIAYKVKETVVPVLPSTGDPSSLLAWVTLLGASGAGLRAMKRRKK